MIKPWIELLGTEISRGTLLPSKKISCIADRPNQKPELGTEQEPQMEPVPQSEAYMPGPSHQLSCSRRWATSHGPVWPKRLHEEHLHSLSVHNGAELVIEFLQPLDHCSHLCQPLRKFHDTVLTLT